MKKIFIVITLSFLNFSFAQSYLGENLSAVFLSEAKLNSFEGKSKNLVGLVDLDKNLVEFYIDLNTLRTGIKLRDKHMRDDYLETKKYPFAEFVGKLSNQDLASISNKKSGTYIVEGNFKVHGIELPREIEVSFKFNENAKKLEIKASFEMKLTDHEIEIPKVMFYELSNTIKITTDGDLVLQ